MTRPLRILFLDDEVHDCELSVRALERSGYSCRWERVDDREGFLAKLDALDADIVLADYKMPGFDGLSALRLFVARGAPVPFVLISGTIGEELATEALKSGATDYVLKTRLSRLAPVVERALAEHAERRERRRVEAELAKAAMVAESLARVSRALIANLNERGLLDILCRATADELAVDSTYTLMREPGSGTFRPVASHGATSDETAFSSTIRVSEERMHSLLGRLAEDEIADIAGELPEGAPAASGPFHRMIGLALRRGSEIIGVQILLDRRRDVVLTAPQRQIAAGIAQLASMALSQARLIQELEHASRVKSDFIATMSHELRTPLHIIMGYTDLLLGETFGAMTAEQVDSLQRIARSAVRLRDLVEWTLDLSRLDANRLPLHIEPVDMTQLVLEVVQQVQDLRRRSEVSITSVLPEGPCFLPTDRRKAAVVIQNLVDNALKFTTHGSVTVALTRPAAGAVTISVTDTGAGIRAADLSRIFEPFVQLDDVMTNPYGGAGLGLHVVRRFVEALGGEIDVQSTPGVGSRFQVTLREMIAPAPAAPDRR